MMTSKSSGTLNAGTTVVINRPCLIHGCSLTQASAACTLTIYDNPTSASGTVVQLVSNATNSSTAVGPMLPYPVECLTGATAVITGTGATGLVFYSAL